MTEKEIFESYNEYILSTYTRQTVVFVKGKGSVLTDVHGKKYLDFFPGWGVGSLGHCHPKVMGAVREQIGKLIHIPNNLYHPYQAKLAKELIRISFPGKVFFCNSGAEAVETAIKYARAFGQGKKTGLIAMLNSFHGRTMGALSATGQDKYQKSFVPLVPGFQHVPLNDIGAMHAAVHEETAAIILELIQGEGGIHTASLEYVRAVRKICDERKILLIIDEIQTGLGRTGRIFCYQHYGIVPDVLCLAKALGGGLPIGAVIVKKEFADIFKPGMHGSTFAGGPLVCHAALGALKALVSHKILANVRAMGEHLTLCLERLKSRYTIIKDIRGRGLMMGVELAVDGDRVFKECFERGLIINCTQGHVLRIMPALNVTKKQVDRAMFVLDKAMTTVVAGR